MSKKISLNSKATRRREGALERLQYALEHPTRLTTDQEKQRIKKQIEVLQERIARGSRYVRKTKEDYTG